MSAPSESRVVMMIDCRMADMVSLVRSNADYSIVFVPRLLYLVDYKLEQPVKIFDLGRVVAARAGAVWRSDGVTCSAGSTLSHQMATKLECSAQTGPRDGCEKRTFCGSSFGCGHSRPSDAALRMSVVTRNGSCGPGNDTCRNHGRSVGARLMSLIALAAVKSSSYSSGVNVVLTQSSGDPLCMHARCACHPVVSVPFASATMWSCKKNPYPYRKSNRVRIIRYSFQ